MNWPLAVANVVGTVPAVTAVDRIVSQFPAVHVVLERCAHLQQRNLAPL